MDSRVCQFNLRGRCNRSSCEFKHVSGPSRKSQNESEEVVKPDSRRPCRFFVEGASVCRFGEACRFSHEKPGALEALESDVYEDGAHSDTEDSSLVSGFTETPAATSGPTIPSKRLEDLSKDWSEEEEEGGGEEEEIASKDKEGSSNKEEWVTLIFGEDGKPSSSAGGLEASPLEEKAKEDKKDMPDMEAKANVYDLTADAEFDKDGSWPGRPRPRGARTRGGLRGRPSRKDGVTKIGNNMYFYTGGAKTPGDPEDEDDDKSHGETEEGGEDDGAWMGSDHEEEEEEEEEAGGDSKSEEKSSKKKKKINGPLGSGPGSSSKGTTLKPKRKTKKHKAHRTDYVYAGKSTAAKTRRCGECENCNKEDCNKCDACRDKPRNGGKGLKKQACIHRVCLWKNPSGKSASVPGGRPRGRPRTRGPPPGLLKAEEAAPAPKRSRLSLPVLDPKGGGPSRGKGLDGDLPTFDPMKFKPGYNPPVVKKGDSEYVVVVTGIKDTGLCGKYWGGAESLPSKRRLRLSGEEQEQQQQSGSTQPAGPPEETRSKKTPQGKRGPSKRRSAAKKELQSSTATQQQSSEGEDALAGVLGAAASSPPPSKRPHRGGEEEMILSDVGEAAAGGAASAGAASSVRSVSCVADTSTQREVTVECFAPYDDHRWVNIGKERDNMAPDSVMYARALRPPYHLLSFLRIKGNSTKGMSCTDRNTMVFVVLEGEISVVLHTTQFSASKGDSFYIPPKNYYNLINQKVREAELSLIQFQYDGPLPTVAASSQSGSGKNTQLPPPTPLSSGGGGGGN